MCTGTVGGNGVPRRRLADGRRDGDVYGRGADRGGVSRGAAGAALPAHQPRHPSGYKI